MATRLLHLSTSHGGRRLFHSSRAARAGGEGPTYEPGGYLFNQKPGVKYEREWWEIPMYFGFGGASIALLVVYNYKPNSSGPASRQNVVLLHGVKRLVGRSRQIIDIFWDSPPPPCQMLEYAGTPDIRLGKRGEQPPNPERWVGCLGSALVAIT
ncbi:hypothetical protein M427DRAFT_49864 [Gonapodya prolifera JEL478]|uniref:NADH dehydrogenase [ubiquinone] 1 beta subcomplex subunit 11, mitochondrial n=1 Tax=Gonapodya prolifera (strain JEL478) TaxID=1344416 RepID=A0A138ZXK7_GONPJ|nr:hypothetical protein M427DRAFT_49864 [Gonapodya prolifera JEL478]|eukprot:KXS09227.1 hypothetical protein M427DRAFT_49864 [Gonapodya prolifera JEL478]